MDYFVIVTCLYYYFFGNLRYNVHDPRGKTGLPLKLEDKRAEPKVLYASINYSRNKQRQANKTTEDTDEELHMASIRKDR